MPDGHPSLSIPPGFSWHQNCFMMREGETLANIKTAFSCWGERIAPVFDTTRQVHVIETAAGCIVSEKKEALALDLPLQKAMRLTELGVRILVCGAISRPLQAMVSSAGIQVIPFVSGDLPEVIAAWLKGRLPGAAFAMPGCQRRIRRSAGGNDFQKEEIIMNGKGQGGGGFGGGRGQGGGGQGGGRMGGPRAAGAVGTCVCPKCGERLAHERGIPCVQRQCPKCGTALTRE
jgi:predicted Fe-Mo cluster-binding NifX family protein